MLNKLNEAGFELSNEQALALGISAFGDVLNVAPEYSKGLAIKQSYDFDAWQLNQNSELLRKDAQDILQTSYDYENKTRIEGMKLRGTQRATMSGSGFEVSSESYNDIIGNTDYNIARNTAAIRREAMGKYASTQARADLMDIQADYNRAASKLAQKRAKKSAIMSGILGAVKLGAMSYFGSIEDMGRSKVNTTGNKITGIVPVQSAKPLMGE